MAGAGAPHARWVAGPRRAVCAAGQSRGGRGCGSLRARERETCLSNTVRACALVCACVACAYTCVCVQLSKDWEGRSEVWRKGDSSVRIKKAGACVHCMREDVLKHAYHACTW